MIVYEYDFYTDGTKHYNVSNILSVSTSSTYKYSLKWDEYGWFYSIGLIGNPQEKQQNGDIRHIRLWSFKKLTEKQEEVLFQEISK